jgi:hypothetical protein
MCNDYFRPSGAKPLDKTPSQAAHEAAMARAAASAGAAPSVVAAEAGASARPSSFDSMPIPPARASSAPVHWQQQRGCETFDFRLQLQQGIPVPLDYAPPYRETARLETFLNQNGLTNVGARLHREMLEAGGQPRRIATMVAGNSGRPAGACGFEDGTIWKLHAGHTTQEEDVVSNWMTTACHNAKRPLASMADGGHDIANAIYQDTIYGKWGMLHPQASDKKTVQRVSARAHAPPKGLPRLLGRPPPLLLLLLAHTSP